MQLLACARKEVINCCACAVVDRNHEHNITAGPVSDGGNHSSETDSEYMSNQRHSCYCSSVAEYWQLKPQALGLTPGSTTFLGAISFAKVYGQ